MYHNRVHERLLISRSTFRVIGLTALAAGLVGCAGSSDGGMGETVSVSESLVTAAATSPVIRSSKAALVSDSAGVGQAFTLAIPSAGRYYVRAWAMGATAERRVTVTVDASARPIGSFATSDSGWRYHDVVSTTGGSLMQLPAGQHSLSFQSTGDQVPDVEYVELSKTPFPADKANENYANYIAALSARSLDASYATVKEGTLALKDGAELAGADPSENYCHTSPFVFSYSYRTTLYLTAGTAIVLETQKADPYASDPVLYLFSQSSPESASWSNDDYYGRQARIAVTIPTTGYYVVLTRAYDSNYPGTSDLYRDGVLYASAIPLGGGVHWCSLGKTGTLNYFTSHIATDTMLWLVDSEGNFPGYVRAFNDDFSGGSDFYWGLASRVRRTSSQTLYYAIVTAYSSTVSSATTDIYLENEDSDAWNWFPNLEAIDAIKSAPETGGWWVPGSYNCISYSGGVTTWWQWQVGDPLDPWYDADPLTSFDKWYGNNPPRYSGAYNYTRSGATSTNSVVDLWANSGSYTHGSVKKPGNGWPHGYDWESKPGGLMRTFHPRNSLNDSSAGGYGAVSNYYRWNGTTASMARTPASGSHSTLEASVAAGDSVMDVASLTSTEASKLATLLATIPAATSQKFQALYEAWEQTWSKPELAKQSDSRKYAASKEYAALLAFCQKQGQLSWPLAFNEHLAGDTFAFLLVEDLALPRYQAQATAVRQKSATPRVDSKGSYVVPSQRANVTRFIQAILAQM